MKRLLVSIGAAFAVAVLTWLAIFVFAPRMNIEKAFIIIFYPSIAAGVITAFAWRRRIRR